MAKHNKIELKTFFLNEQHEMKRGEKDGRGGLPQYAPIDWALKGANIYNSLKKARNKISKSKDPLASKHLFLIANPEKHLIKKSTSKNKPSEYKEDVVYSKNDSLVFQRLGLDLLQVNDDGTAAIHARPEQIDRLLATSEKLNKFGKREQNRWAKISDFDIIPEKYRVDLDWLNSTQFDKAIDVVIELQPLLIYNEVDIVLKTILELLKETKAGRLIGGGQDFSGRQWYRGTIKQEVLHSIAKEYYSIQSLHSPLTSIAAGGNNTQNATVAKLRRKQVLPVINTSDLPCVAVLDTGVPSGHILLSPYRRGQYRDPSIIDDEGSHGSFVASRIIFGDKNYKELSNQPTGDCCYYDAKIALRNGDIDDKDVYQALEAIVRTSPDVRVFNFSFDGLISNSGTIINKERLRIVQDLDNFIFANDILVVIASGNSPIGVLPNNMYPNHHKDPNWAMGHWSKSFNSLTCGYFVQLESIGNGLVRNSGWPSPFSRVGPGLCNSPKPDFSAHGGNCTEQYTFKSGLGVWGIDNIGRVEDRIGTSFSTPLLARQAAIALKKIGRYCDQGARAYAVTVKAFLALTATHWHVDDSIKALAKVSLGKGEASYQRLDKPNDKTAVLIWQGMLENPKDTARVRIPVPKEWVKKAGEPRLRIVLAWDTPVNSEVIGLWGCRKIEAQFRLGPGAKALSSKGRSHISYPLIERLYNLKKDEKKINGDEWLLELSYKETAAYQASIDFAPQQRVAFAAELVDYAEKPVSPQVFLQELPLVASMTRLSLPPVIMRSPVLIKSHL